MARIPRIVQNESGWSEWLVPRMKNYRMVCCDCGLAHDIEFQVLEVLKTKRDGSHLVQPVKTSKLIVQFRARRNERSTAQLRRQKENHSNKGECMKKTGKSQSTYEDQMMMKKKDMKMATTQAAKAMPKKAGAKKITKKGAAT